MFYGSDPKLSKKIITLYGKQITTIIDGIDIEMRGMLHNERLTKKALQQEELTYTKKYNILIKKRKTLLEKIQKEQDLLYIESQTFTYFPEQTTYTTLEVITRNNTERLQFVPKHYSHAAKSKAQMDIINQMITYHRILNTLLMEKKNQ